MPADCDSTARALALPTSPPDSPTLTHQHPRWSRQGGSNPLTRSQSSFRRSNSGIGGRAYRKLDNLGREMLRRFTPVQLALLTVAGIVVFVLSILFLVFHERFFAWLEPNAVKWKNLRGGWCILWAITFLTAFPPLVGYSTCFTLAGFVYGLPEGYAFSLSLRPDFDCPRIELTVALTAGLSSQPRPLPDRHVPSSPRGQSFPGMCIGSSPKTSVSKPSLPY